MQLKTIKIENFYSIQNIELKLDRYKGIVFIEGKNKDVLGSNGLGKSSILEAIVWGLFGKTIRKSTEEAVINNLSKKGCRVTLTFQDSVKIIRSKKPGFLEFFVGEDNRTKDSQYATQLEIDKYFNTNYKVFLSSTLFGQNNELDFISATPDDKRLIIKNFLNLNEIFDLREKIKSSKLEQGTNVKVLTALLDEKNKELTKIKADIQYAEYGEDKYLEDNGLSLSSIENLTLEDIIVKEELLLKCKESYLHTENNLNSFKKELTKLEKYPTTVGYTYIECDYCGSKSVDEGITEDKIKEIQQKINDCKINIDTYEILLGIEDLKIKKFIVPISSKDYTKIINWQKLRDKKDYLKEQEKVLEDKVAELNLKIKEASKQYDIMKFWEVAFSEQGLIQYIIKNILDFFNDKVKYYLNILTNGKYKVVFNEKLEETISISGKELHYISLSGGEKQRINIAVLLSLQELLVFTEKSSSNMLFLDEVATNIDKNGLSSIYNLLQELKKQRTIFIITHNSDLKHMFEDSESIMLEKRNGVTKLI